MTVLMGVGCHIATILSGGVTRQIDAEALGDEKARVVRALLRRVDRRMDPPNERPIYLRATCGILSVWPGLILSGSDN